LGYSRLIWFTLAGVAAGYLLMHPFAMLAYLLAPQPPADSLALPLWGSQIKSAFGPEMLAMGGAFAFMGGVAGLCLGAWHLQRMESQRRRATLQTLQELMVTLAHYLRNANQVIGGYSAHLQKHIDHLELLRQLELIHQAAHKIDRVVNSLESLTEMNQTGYIGTREKRMIDLKQDLESRLVPCNIYSFG
jgi:signal transduction histidine kinase